MNFLSLFKRLFGKKKTIDVRRLPSQGFFYKSDFKIHIKRADIADIAEYESGYDRENVGSVLSKLKSIVRKNVILENGYEFNHIKSIDVVYLFLEIVKMTKGKPVQITYYDEENDRIENVEFGTDNFNYFVPNEHLLECWNADERCFEVNGYKLSLPTIGIENSLTQFLIEMSYEPGAEKYNDFSYNFTFFLDGKERLRFEEIDNLIQIFNFDIDEEEKKKIDEAVDMIKPMQRYSLRKNGRIIDLSAKINLEKIWK